MPGGLDAPYTVRPEQVHDPPGRVRYPAENIEGWLVPGSYTHLRQDGVDCLGFLVRHAAIVRLGRAQAVR